MTKQNGNSPPSNQKNELRIRNCSWGYKCEKTWDSLIATDLPTVKYCDACERGVYLCLTQEELVASVVLNRCVAFRPDLLEELDRPVDTGPVSPATNEWAELSSIGSEEDLFVIGDVDSDYYINARRCE